MVGSRIVVVHQVRSARQDNDQQQAGEHGAQLAGVSHVPGPHGDDSSVDC